MLPMRIEAGEAGVAVPDYALPSVCVVVPGQERAKTLTGSPIYDPWATAYLTWRVAASATALQYWKGKAGKLGHFMLPSPLDSVGTITRSSVDYASHALYTYGVVSLPRFASATQTLGATLNGTAAVILKGQIVITITDLSRYPSWPF